MAEQMHLRLIYIFMQEILNQCDAATLSAANLDALLAQLRQRDPLAPGAIPIWDLNNAIFVAIQGILTAGALVSKMLIMSQPQRPAGCRCPEDPGAEEKHAQAKLRCKTLRSELGIRGRLPPELDSRIVRNGFEHIDDRIDSYFVNAKLFVDRNIGPPNAVMTPDGPPKVLRQFDPATTIVTVMDASISLRALMDALADIANRARNWHAQNPNACFGTRLKRL